MSNYIFQTPEESKRLKLLDRTHGKFSRKILSKFIEEEMICHIKTISDIGCGTGLMLHFLSCFCEKVVAIDADMNRLKIGQETNGNKNIEYLCLDITNKQFFERMSLVKSDFIYIRFLLHHLKNPKKTLRALLELPTVKHILVEEVDHSTWGFDGDIIREVGDEFVSIGFSRSLDYTLGSKLRSLCSSFSSFGFDVSRDEETQPVYFGDNAMMPIFLIDSIKKEIIYRHGEEHFIRSRKSIINIINEGKPIRYPKISHVLLSKKI